ncbi:MAG: hypothetical protein A2X48_12750 [Lentisphaerae bacterium GWF2_49_21]|nr:MAG: hypothetical protein A2X48_12750 [Lentisphaerae bacterium GWF2_49_21]
MYQLEERILFDGAAAADITAAQQEQQAQQTESTQTPAEPQTDTASDQDQAQSIHDTSPVLPTDSAPSVPATDASADISDTSAAIAPPTAANPTPHVNVLVVSDSLENADSLFQSANSDTIVVRYNAETTSGTQLLQEINDALEGQKADSIGFVTDKAHDGSVSIFSDGATSDQTLSSEAQQNFWNGIEGMLSEKGRINIFASDLASTDSGRHLVDSLSQITDHQVAASADVTGDTDAGGNWELEYVAKGTDSVDLIDEYFSREAIQSFDHRIEDPTEIAFIDSSVRDIDTIVSQLDSDVEVVYLSKDNAFSDITEFLSNRTDVDAIHLISDGTAGEIYLGYDTVNSEFIAAHQADLAAWGKSMSADGDIHIYGCNVAETQVGKDLANQISVITGADVAASVDRTGLAGNWNLEYTTGDVQTAGFVIGDYNHNLKTITVKRLDDYVVQYVNPNATNLTLREAILIAVDGDNIAFADYTVLHNASSSMPDLQPWYNGHPFIGSTIYNDVVVDSGAVNNPGGYAKGTTTIAYSGLLGGSLAVGSFIYIDGDAAAHRVTALGAGTITFASTPLAVAIVDTAVITCRTPSLGLADTLTISKNITIDGAILTPAWTDSTTTPVTNHNAVNNSVILDGQGLFRVIYIDSQMGAGNTGVSLTNIVIQNGRCLSTDNAPAAGNGGGIYISSVSALTTSSTTSISGNQAPYGGGIYNAGVLTLGGQVSGNTADNGAGTAGNGGGIYNAGSLTATAGYVYSNTSIEHGGGIYNNGTITITGTSAVNPFNIGIDPANAAAGNTAGGSGGGIYSNNGNISLENVDVSYNAAGLNGGGIYLFSNYTQSSPMSFNAVDVEGNTADNDGGGFYMTNGNSTATNVLEWEWSQITANFADADFDGVGNGGGICLFNNAGSILLKTSISLISHNTRSSIDSNFAVNGGGIYIENCANVTMDFLRIMSNTATVNGGAIFVKDSGTITLTDMEIASNSAVDGGGIYYTNVTTGTLDIQRSSLNNNTATGDGGGIYIDKGNLNITNDTLAYNDATDGGAIYMGYGNLTVKYATLGYNTDAGNGAAIYILGDAVNKSTLVVEGSIIYNLTTDAFTSQIYIPVAAQITTTGFSMSTNIYSHYHIDRLANPLNSLNLDSQTANKLIGTDAGKSTLIENNLFLDTVTMYQANYRTKVLTIMSEDSWAYAAMTPISGITYDQRGNTRTGTTWTWDNVKQTWVTAAKSKTTIGAFDPIFHTEVTSKGDDSQLWWTFDENSHYFDVASAGGLTLREAIYWIDSRITVADPTEYSHRYVGFDAIVFASTNPDNIIQLNYGEIEIGGRWGNWDSSNNSWRDIAIGYLIRDVDGSGDITAHDNTLRAKDDPSRITVLAGNSGGGVNRLFLNTDGSVLAINNLTLSGGVATVDSTENSLDAMGGGIRNAANLTLVNVTVQNSSSSGTSSNDGWFVTPPGGGVGGGLFNSATGTAFIYDSSFLNNTVTCTGVTGANPKNTASAGWGGGLANLGTITIDRSQFCDNTAQGATDIGTAMLGGGIYNGGTMNLSRSEITGNTVKGSTSDKSALQGGGIYNGATLNMVNCTIGENTLDTTGVKIDYAANPPAVPVGTYTFGSFGSGVYNAGTIDSYYNTIIKNNTIVTDQSFWDTKNSTTIGLEAMAGFYNAGGALLIMSNSLIAENMAIMTVTGAADILYQRSDIFIYATADVIAGDYNIIGAYNTPRTEQYYTYVDSGVGVNTPIFYERTYDTATSTWTNNAVYEYVPQATGAPIVTGHDWTAGVGNQLGYTGAFIPTVGVTTYLSVNITDATNIPLAIQQPPYNSPATPFIYVAELDGFGAPTGKYFRINADGSYTTLNPGNTFDGLYTLAGVVWSVLGGGTLDNSFTVANTTPGYPNDTYTTVTPMPITVITAAGGIPNVINPQYGLVAGLNIDWNLNYNGGMTRTYRILNGSVAMDAGVVVANPFGAIPNTVFFTDQRGAPRVPDVTIPAPNIGDPTNIGAFDYLSGNLIVKTTYDSATPRVGFDYTTYTPLWDSSTLTLREACLLADDGSDITFKDTWQINGSKYIDPVTLQVYTVGLTGTTAFPATGTSELNASGQLIITLVGGELTLNRTVTIDGIYDWNVVDANGNITLTHTGSIAQIVASANSRLFNIKSDVPGNLSTVGMSNMVMSGGNVIGNGGGILSSANLWLDNVTIQNCKANVGSSGTDGMGGGIYSDQGYLQMVNSTISGNTATFGGGLYVSGKNNGGGVVLDIGHTLIGAVNTFGGCSIINNTANNATNGSGGGVYLLSGNGNVIFSTLGGNKAVSDGGGIYVATTGNLAMTNSTVANNTAGRHGGGISFNSNNNLDLDYTTIANNQSGWTILGVASGNGFATGGGIYLNSGTLNLTNSILAQNFCGKFNNATALIQSGNPSIAPSVAITLANQNLGIHDDLFSYGTNNISNSVYGAVYGYGAPAASKAIQSTDWATFSTQKLDSKLTDNGGHSKTIFVYNPNWFNMAVGGAGFDQTELENFASRITSGAYENSVSKVLYYFNGEITKGRDGGSTWISANGIALTEADGVLNANNAIFAFDDTQMDPLLVPAGKATLNYSWTINGPDWVGKYTSKISVVNNAYLAIAATVGTTTTPVTLNGRIVLNDNDIQLPAAVAETATLEFLTYSIDSTKLSVNHTATSNTTVIYDSVNATQKVLAVDAITQQAMKYDSLLLYGKVGATLSTKSAWGPINVYSNFEVGNGTDNVKLNVFTVTGAGTANLQILGPTLHNFGEINAAAMTITGTTIDSGGKLTATSNVTMTNVIINTQRTITVGGNLFMNNVAITGLVAPNSTVINVTGDVHLDGGIIDLTNLSLVAGSNKTVFMGDTALTTVNLYGNVTIGAATNTVKMVDSDLIVTGLNNNIVSKGLDLSTWNWAGGRVIQVTDPGVPVPPALYVGSLKINIGAQNLTIVPNGTTSTATLLTLGLDTLTIAANNRFEVVTTGTVLSTAAGAAPGAIDGTLALAGKITLNNTFVDVVKATATLELGGTITIPGTFTTANSLFLVGSAKVVTLPLAAITIQSTGGSLSIGTMATFTGNAQNLTLLANNDITLGSVTNVKTLTVTATLGNINLLTSISVGGDLVISAGGNVNAGGKTLSATGNITFNGDITLQNITVVSPKTISFGGDMILSGNTTIGSATSIVKLNNPTNVIVTALNNNIVTKGLDITNWLAGTIQVIDGANGSLKLTIGTQNLSLVPIGTGGSTATLLSLDVTRLDINANNRFEIVTTGTTPIAATAAGLAATIDGTLALNGKVNLNDTIFTLELNAGATLEFMGEVTIKKDGLLAFVTINKDSNLTFTGNVKVDTLVTGAVSITANGDVTIGNSIIAGPKFTGNKGALNITSVTGDIWIGNVLNVGAVTIDDGGGAGDNIFLTNSINSTGNILFTSGSAVVIQPAKATATATVLSPISIITTGLAGTITSPNGFMSGPGGASELQLTASIAGSNIGTFASNNSLTVVKGTFTATSIDLTAAPAPVVAPNLTNKGTLTVNGNITLAGGKLDNYGLLTIGAAGNVTLTNGGIINQTLGTIDILTGEDFILNGTAYFTNSNWIKGDASTDITMGTGLLNNIKKLEANSITYVGNGTLTNAGTMTLSNNITLVGNGALNNNTGTLTANAINMATGTLTSKAILNTDTITFTGNGNIVNSNFMRGASGVGDVVDITLAGGNLTNTGTMSVDALDFTGSGAVIGNLNNNTGTLTANTIDMVNGTLTSKAALNSNTITFTGTGSIVNSNVMKGVGLVGTPVDITLAGGNLTNTGTMTVDALILTGAGAINNNTGTLTTNTVDLVNGTITNKATLISTDITFTGTGNLVNSMNIRGVGALPGGPIDITFAGGSLTNTGSMVTVDALILTGAGAINNNTGTLTANTIDMVDGNLTNKANLNVTNGVTGINITGTGNIVNTMALKANVITLANGNLTNSGTGTIAEIAGAAINNLAGYPAGTTTIAVDGIKYPIANGSVITIAGDPNTHVVTGTVGGSTPTSITFLTALVNPILNNAVVSNVSTITLNGAGKTLTNSGTSLIIDNLTLNGSNLDSSKTLTVGDTLTLTGAGTRNIKLAGTFALPTTTIANLVLNSDAIMSQGAMRVTNFTFGGAPVYFQMNNTTVGTSTTFTSLEINNNLVGCDATHYFVTDGTSKVYVKATNVMKSVFMTDLVGDPVIQIDITSPGNVNKLVGLNTFYPITVNGKYDGIPVGASNLVNTANRVWTVTRATGDVSALTMKFWWDVTEQGAGLNITDGSLFFSSGTGWVTGPAAGTGGGLDLGNHWFGSSNVTTSGSYSVSNYPMLAMIDSVYSTDIQFDDLEEEFIDAIMSGREEIVEPQLVAEAQEKAAADDMFAQMADRGRLMERNNLFKSEVDLGLEALLAV